MLGAFSNSENDNSRRSTIVDPQILELSGIGRRVVLDKIGIDIKIELGENVQDHTVFPAIYELGPKTDHRTTDLARDPTYLAKALKLQYVPLASHKIMVKVLCAEGQDAPSIVMSTAILSPVALGPRLRRHPCCSCTCCSILVPLPSRLAAVPSALPSPLRGVVSPCHLPLQTAGPA